MHFELYTMANWKFAILVQASAWPCLQQEWRIEVSRFLVRCGLVLGGCSIMLGQCRILGFFYSRPSPSL